MHGKENIINKKNIAEVSQDNCSFEDKPAVNMCVGYSIVFQTCSWGTIVRRA